MLELLQSPVLLILAVIGFVIIVFTIYYSLLLLVKTYLLLQKMFLYIKRKSFQNLDNFIFKSLVSISVLSCVVSWIILGKDILVVTCMSCITFILIAMVLTKGFISLDDSIRAAFNDDKGWWSKLWGNIDAVDSKLLDIYTYENQVKKIKTELFSKINSLEHSKRLENELAHTVGIIENINVIFKKALKGETTMLNNLGLLRASYSELHARYQYFEKQYHELLHDNYDVKNAISQTVSKNQTIEEQKDILKNL
jgi:hypothetical protein